MTNQTLLLIGWSHKNAPVEFRDRLVLSRDEILQFMEKSKSCSFVSELAILSTCNRTEFYFCTTAADQVQPWLMEQYSSSLQREITWKDYQPSRMFDEQAAEHLCRVASGMESMMLGENQILSQVKSVNDIILTSKGKSPILNQLVRDAVRCGKAVRTDTNLCKGAVSVSLAAVELSKRIYSEFHHHKVLLVGAGESAELAGRHFSDLGVGQFYIANRSESTGRELAEKIGGEYIQLSAIPEKLATIDIAVTATHAKDHLITFEQVTQAMTFRHHKNLLLLDISSPRNIEPKIQDIPEVFLYDIDHLQGIIAENLEKRKKELTGAESIVQIHKAAFMAWYKTLQVRPTIASLSQYFESIRETELQRFKNKTNGKEFENLDQLSRGIIRKLLHYPISHLKELNEEEMDPGAIDAIWKLYKLSEFEKDQVKK